MFVLLASLWLKNDPHSGSRGFAVQELIGFDAEVLSEDPPRLPPLEASGVLDDRGISETRECVAVVLVNRSRAQVVGIDRDLRVLEAAGEDFFFCRADQERADSHSLQPGNDTECPQESGSPPGKPREVDPDLPNQVTIAFRNEHHSFAAGLLAKCSPDDAAMLGENSEPLQLVQVIVSAVANVYGKRNSNDGLHHRWLRASVSVWASREHDFHVPREQLLGK